MTDKPNRIERWAGCNLNDPKARLTGSEYLGEPFVVSSTNALNPATGKGVESIKHIPNEN